MLPNLLVLIFLAIDLVGHAASEQRDSFERSANAVGDLVLFALLWWGGFWAPLFGR